MTPLDAPQPAGMERVPLRVGQVRRWHGLEPQRSGRPAIAEGRRFTVTKVGSHDSPTQGEYLDGRVRFCYAPADFFEAHSIVESEPPTTPDHTP